MNAKDTPLFDEIIHSPVRLRICGLLRHLERAEFQFIRSTLDITDANLSKNLKVLTDAGYVEVTKATSSLRTDFRRMTWVRLTNSGKIALKQHLSVLQDIANGSILS